MAKIRARQMSLPFVTAELSRRLNADAHRRAVDLIKQMLVDAVLAGHPSAEDPHEREDQADPS